MNSSVIVFPGSNCDRDIAIALEKMQFHNKMIWHKENTLPKSDLIVIPGGFSYGDYLRSGAIAAKSNILNEVIKAANSGCLVLGICNGFQILCEAGLLPGALLHNNNQKFICKNTFLKACSDSAGITENVNKNKAYKIPIAHGEGKYYEKKNVVEDLFENDQVLFQYCDLKGNVSEDDIPNGSLQNIAGVSNKNKNVMGMMPHPERAVEPLLGNTDGVPLFQSLLNSSKA